MTGIRRKDPRTGRNVTGTRTCVLGSLKVAVHSHQRLPLMDWLNRNVKFLSSSIAVRFLLLLLLYKMQGLSSLFLFSVRVLFSCDPDIFK